MKGTYCELTRAAKSYEINKTVTDNKQQVK